MSRLRLLRIYERRADAVDVLLKARIGDTIIADIGLALGQSVPVSFDALDAALADAFVESEIEEAFRDQALWLSDHVIPALASTSPFRPVWRRAGVAAHRTLAECMAAARQPWPVRLTAMRRLTGDRTYAWIPVGGETLATQGLVGVCNLVAEAMARSIAGINAARVALRLERDRLAGGAVPDALDESVLSGTVDPFTGGALLYRREPDGFVVYSVGADGNDDRGEVIDTEAPGGRIGVAPGKDAGVRVRIRPR